MERKPVCACSNIVFKCFCTINRTMTIQITLSFVREWKWIQEWEYDVRCANNEQINNVTQKIYSYDKGVFFKFFSFQNHSKRKKIVMYTQKYYIAYYRTQIMLQYLCIEDNIRLKRIREIRDWYLDIYFHFFFFFFVSSVIIVKIIYSI